MADNIDKGLYQLPQGMPQATPQEPVMEIEIEDPESVKIGVDGLEIEIEPSKEVDDEFNANLAEELDEGTLTELSGDLVGDFTSDIESRKDWLNTYVEGLELLGLKVEDRTD